MTVCQWTFNIQKNEKSILIQNNVDEFPICPAEYFSEVNKAFRGIALLELIFIIKKELICDR